MIGARAALPLALGLALMAGVGVLLIVAPFAKGPENGWEVDLFGVGFALVAALGRALYILLSRGVGFHFSHSEGLCFSFLTAAVPLAPTGFGGFDRMPDISLISSIAALAILAGC